MFDANSSVGVSDEEDSSWPPQMSLVEGSESQRNGSLQIWYASTNAVGLKINVIAALRWGEERGLFSLNSKG